MSFVRFPTDRKIYFLEMTAASIGQKFIEQHIAGRQPGKIGVECRLVKYETFTTFKPEVTSDGMSI
jgi:hypothetical protein